MVKKYLILFFILIISPNLVFASINQPYLDQINIQEAWKYSQGSSNVLVAILDNGIDDSHPLLNNQIVSGGKNFLFNSSILSPYGDHGTMLAGIIGSTGSEGTVLGINKQISILPIIVCHGYGCNTEALIQGIIYAADKRADIINLSLGGMSWNEYENIRIRNAINYAYNKGSIIIAAAGNGYESTGIGKNLNILANSPVCEDKNDFVVGVASVDKNNIKSTFSDYGSRCVDVVAPGEDILSLSIPHYNNNSSIYSFGDGTSFSTAIVSGVAALIKSINPNLSNAKIINILKESAINIDYQNDPIYRNQLGSGLINAGKAASMARSSIVNVIDRELSYQLRGRILLQVEGRGEAWYVNPSNGKRYYMANGDKAYNIMRNFGIGITNNNLNQIRSNKTIAKKYSGKIFLQVESKGEAYYIDFNGNAHYLKDGAAAFTVMRNLGLGITNTNLNKIPEGSL